MTLPQRIGKYEIVRELGAGAMGTVYEGFDAVIERRVAIKTIGAKFLAEGTEAAVNRFKREAQAAGRLQHPGIVAVYEYGEEPAQAYIVMEFLQGQNLRQLMRAKGRLDLIDSYGLTRQLLMALGYSHEQGVVHRDIKPANLMVTGTGALKLKVMDFGIARIEGSAMTQTGSVIGTPTHMAPEQLMGQPVDGRADLWSAGVILYELLTGRSPFSDETPLAAMHHVLNADPAPPSAVDERIGTAFDAVMVRALAKRPAERFQTAAQFSAALLSAFRGRAAAAQMQPANHDARHTPSPVQATRQAFPGAVDAPGEPAALSATLPVHILLDVETALARAIGPLARQLVRRAAAGTHNVERFYAVLADAVPDGAEREAFVAHLRGLDVGSSAAGAAPVAPAAASRPQVAQVAATPSVVFDAALLARCEKQLAQHIGPLARVLIKRAANDSGNVSELVRRLADHIDSEPERRAFLESLR